MLQLNDELPTYDETLSVVQRDTDSQETSMYNNCARKFITCIGLS